MSAGVKGFRVGVGPRGGYVHAGRGGIYYRQTIGNVRRQEAVGRRTRHRAPLVPTTPADGGLGNLEQDLEQLHDATAGDLVRRISEAAALKKPSWFANPFTYKQRRMNWEAARVCPVFYELDDDVHRAYERVVDAGLALATAPGRWYDASQSYVTGAARNKGNAGAGTAVSRLPLEIVAEAMAIPTFNFEPLALVAPIRKLILLPDQVLVQQGNSFGALLYSGLRLETVASTFITPLPPPGVAPIGRTWQFVNAKGGPDLRYNNNPELPIIETWQLDFHHDSGFQFHTAFTDRAGTENLAGSIADLIALLPRQ